MNWRVDLWSSPYHEELIADIYFGDQFVALVDQEARSSNLHISFADNTDALRRIPLYQL
jgi:hypothetical protein